MISLEYARFATVKSRPAKVDYPANAGDDVRDFDPSGVNISAVSRILEGYVPEKYRSPSTCRRWQWGVPLRLRCP